MCGRNALAWDERFALDVWYVDHLGLWLDLKILACTAWAVVTGAGVTPPGQLVSEEFMGERPPQPTDGRRT